MAGIKETKEVAVGLVALLSVLAEAFKDGVQAGDFVTIVAKIQGDAELSAKLLAAYNDVDLVKDEVKEVSAEEVLEVLAAIVPEIKKLLLAIKK